MPKYSPQRRASYNVGYARPPVASRFKPGQSGNPRGRPRKSPPEDPELASLDPLLAATLRVMSEGTPVSAGGRVKTVSGEEAVVRALMDRALLGDIRSTRTLLELRERAKVAVVQARAYSASTIEFSQFMSGLIREAKKPGHENADGPSDAPQITPPEGVPGSGREDRSASTEAERLTPKTSRGDFEDGRLYRDPERAGTEVKRAEARAEANDQHSPEPAPHVTPPPVYGGRGGPLIASSQALPRSGFGVGGRSEPAPRCGPFK